jgi:hypothetical protein
MPPSIRLYNADMQNVLSRTDGDDFTFTEARTAMRIQQDVSRGIDLLFLDPPWRFEQRHGTTSADDHYDTMTAEQVIEACAPWVQRARLVVCWVTWPILGEFMVPIPRWNAYPISGGAWTKSNDDNDGHYGQGYWWAGCSEPVLLYRGGLGQPHNDRTRPLRNGWQEKPTVHSRKPVVWQAAMVRRWVPEGGLVADPFAGLASTGEATLLAGGGRSWIGIEKDRERFERGGQNLELRAAKLPGGVPWET